MEKIDVSDAWQVLIDKYDIVTEISKNGFFKISASQIKEVKEPRLLAKWDSSKQLPSSLKNNKINILNYLTCKLLMLIILLLKQMR